jgi:hypothetical protein
VELVLSSTKKGYSSKKKGYSCFLWHMVWLGLLLINVRIRHSN